MNQEENIPIQSWDKFNIPKERYEYLRKEIKKTLIDVDEDYLEAIDKIFPDLNAEQKILIDIYSELYALFCIDVMKEK